MTPLPSTSRTSLAGNALATSSSPNLVRLRALSRSIRPVANPPDELTPDKTSHTPFPRRQFLPLRTMASKIGPRSVKDATRFTSTIPHATSKSAASAVTPKASPRIPGESPEQRVRRLRMAHLAAQKAQISKTDKFIDASRRFFDVAHRWTVGGIVLFTAVAGVVSIYSVWDMLRYNRARRAEWVEAQKQLEADELASARLAYLKGEATEEQIELVEEANREAEAKGTKLPPLLAAPTTRTHFEEHVKPAFEGSNEVDSSESTKKTGKGIMGVFSGILGREEQGEDFGSSQGRLGYESLSEEDDSTGVRDSDLVRSIEAKARGAWEKEKENQRRGGDLDHLGLEPAGGPAPKKSWWRFW
ncbi:cytochrome oxidase c assembly-domain-containing protein [Thelonectria olida]|uniref:Cytochrome oxidase c assembly-domain-containing protein n=1 Tax=Thelonectria olida TaxID=1576542 RepID=A0A9P8W922_9HYPO|nr:cytochrome oxidase c assembly-domain-containing protein [Thelonectria olida]